MQTVQGAPFPIVPTKSTGGLLPRIGTVFAYSNVTLILIWPRYLPAPSNTSIRELPRLATYTFPWLSVAMLWGVLSCPGPLPGSPNDLIHLPSLSYLATRELMYPSLMKVSPAASQAMSVTCRNIPSTGGNGGLGCLSASVPSSEASCLRPNTMMTLPSGLNLITMSEPLSAAQMLSSLSIRTVCANDQA